ncbi:MAG: 3'-5' exonuclease, partial [Sphingobacteriaceae bacterium]
NGIKDYTENESTEDIGLGGFLQDVALLTGNEAADEQDKDTVSLMTIHSAKGLEFKNVYIVGLEENLFPSQMSLTARTDLEEERRLFYVAITRAESKLTLSFATSRYRWGSLISCEPSRFIDEIDSQYLDPKFTAKPLKNAGYLDHDTNSYTKISPTNKPTPQKPVLAKAFMHQVNGDFIASDPKEIEIGMEVEHQKFGFGKVLTLDGPPSDIKTTILFKELGQKQLLLKFAKLRIVK